MEKFNIGDIVSRIVENSTKFPKGTSAVVIRNLSNKTVQVKLPDGSLYNSAKNYLEKKSNARIFIENI